MSESLKAAVQAAVLRILEPLVVWLLEAGIGVGDLQPLIKTAYVRIARERIREAGGEYSKPNASRISIVTGLTRRDVASILATDESRPTHDRGRQRVERVLSGWWNDAVFQDPSGQPAALPVRGAKQSFAALVERYSGERTQVGTILSELLRVKAVRRRPDGRLEPLSRTYATVRWDPEGVTAFGEQVAELCTTLLQNLKSPKQPRFVRRVLNSRLNPRYLPLLVRDIEEQAEGFADTVDETLNDPLHTLTGKDADALATSLGLAIYTFESTQGAEAPKNVSPRPSRKRRGDRGTRKSVPSKRRSAK
jgi:hypothetical protein